MNVDFAFHRRRLWTLSDNQIGHYFSNWQSARRHKEELMVGRFKGSIRSEVIASSSATREESPD